MSSKSTSNPSARIASEEDIAHLLRHSATGSPLAPAKRYPELDVEAVPQAYRLDEVDIQIEEAELEALESAPETPPAFRLQPHRNLEVISRKHKTGRGVTHIRPGRVIGGALAYLTTWFAMLGTLIGLPIWMFVSHGQETSLWMLAPLGILLLALIWAIRSVPRARCTVCMQPMFLNLSCHRNTRAHRFAFGSTALSAALVAILTFRLRCPYCGTKQHLLGRKTEHQAHKRGHNHRH